MGEEGSAGPGQPVFLMEGRLEGAELCVGLGWALLKVTAIVVGIPSP